ncbi:MAG: FCD domain-containing protein [Frankiales bacterium]|nr:FCD domain-containing protein [Frankiales bacterium]
MQKAFQPVRVPLPDQIRDHLRGLIADGELGPGDALPSERELAARLGVSRHSLRQALASLAAIGLVETRHGSGVYLTASPSDDTVTRFADVLFTVNTSIGDALEARLAFEPSATRLAAERRTDDDLELLTAALDVQHDLSAGDAASSEASSFHHQLARTTGNPVFAGLLRSVTTGPRNVSLLAAHTHDGPARWHREHVAILDAVRRGNGARAQRLMASHLEQMLAVARSLESTH